MTSPVVVGYMIIVALLLLPEVSEMEFAGLFKLRRDVAEARAEAAEAKEAVIRLSASNAAASSAVARGGDSTVQVVNNIGRDELTALGFVNLQHGTGEHQDLGGPELQPQIEEVGEASLVAFRAGLVGLAYSLPAIPGGISELALLGLTLDENRDRLEVSHDPFGADGKLAARALDLLNDDWPLQGNVLAIGVDGWIFAAPASDPSGRLVGALAVLVAPPPVDEGSLAADDDSMSDLIERIAAGVEIAADAYARMLIDLLGERPAP